MASDDGRLQDVFLPRIDQNTADSVMSDNLETMVVMDDIPDIGNELIFGSSSADGLMMSMDNSLAIPQQQAPNMMTPTANNTYNPGQYPQHSPLMQQSFFMSQQQQPQQHPPPSPVQQYQPQAMMMTQQITFQPNTSPIQVNPPQNMQQCMQPTQPFLPQQPMQMIAQNSPMGLQPAQSVRPVTQQQPMQQHMQQTNAHVIQQTPPQSPISSQAQYMAMSQQQMMQQQNLMQQQNQQMMQIQQQQQQQKQQQMIQQKQQMIQQQQQQQQQQRLQQQKYLQQQKLLQQQQMYTQRQQLQKQQMMQQQQQAMNQQQRLQQQKQQMVLHQPAQQSPMKQPLLPPSPSQVTQQPQPKPKPVNHQSFHHNQAYPQSQIQNSSSSPATALLQSQQLTKQQLMQPLPSKTLPSAPIPSQQALSNSTHINSDIVKTEVPRLQCSSQNSGVARSSMAVPQGVLVANRVPLPGVALTKLVQSITAPQVATLPTDQTAVQEEAMKPEKGWNEAKPVIETAIAQAKEKIKLEQKEAPRQLQENGTGAVKGRDSSEPNPMDTERKVENGTKTPPKMVSNPANAEKSTTDQLKEKPKAEEVISERKDNKLAQNSESKPQSSLQDVPKTSCSPAAPTSNTANPGEELSGLMAEKKQDSGSDKIVHNTKESRNTDKVEGKKETGGNHEEGSASSVKSVLSDETDKKPDIKSTPSTSQEPLETIKDLPEEKKEPKTSKADENIKEIDTAINVKSTVQPLNEEVGPQKVDEDAQTKAESPAAQKNLKETTDVATPVKTKEEADSANKPDTQELDPSEPTCSKSTDENMESNPNDIDQNTSKESSTNEKDNSIQVEEDEEESSTNGDETMSSETPSKKTTEASTSTSPTTLTNSQQSLQVIHLQLKQGQVLNQQGNSIVNLPKQLTIRDAVSGKTFAIQNGRLVAVTTAPANVPQVKARVIFTSVPPKTAVTQSTLTTVAAVKNALSPSPTQKKSTPVSSTRTSEKRNHPSKTSPTKATKHVSSEVQTDKSALQPSRSIPRPTFLSSKSPIPVMPGSLVTVPPAQRSDKINQPSLKAELIDNDAEKPVVKRKGRPKGSKDKYKRKTRGELRTKDETVSGKAAKNSPSAEHVKPQTSETKQTGKTMLKRKAMESHDIPMITIGSQKKAKISTTHKHRRHIASVYKATNDGRPWLCSLCGQPSNVNFLGGLYGPYYKPEVVNDNEADGNDGEAEDLKTEPKPEVWVHRDCAIWSQDVYLMGHTVHGLTQAVETATEHTCSMCSKKGANLQCFRRSCKKKYHYPCASKRGCFFKEDNFTVFCPDHKP